MSGRKGALGLNKQNNFASLHGDRIRRNAALSRDENGERDIERPPEDSDEDEHSGEDSETLPDEDENDYLVPSGKRRKILRSASPQKSPSPMTSSAKSTSDPANDPDWTFRSAPKQKRIKKTFGRSSQQKSSAKPKPHSADAVEASAKEAPKDPKEASRKFVRPPTVRKLDVPIQTSVFKAPKKAGDGLAKEQLQNDNLHTLRRVVEAAGLSQHGLVLEAMKTAVDMSSTLSSVATGGESAESTPLSTPPLMIDTTPCSGEKVLLSTPKPVQKLCPVCESAISHEVYEEFMDQTFPQSSTEKTYGAPRPRMRLNMRQQTRMCRYHREREAAAVWKERGYPDIDWGMIERRLQLDQREIKRLVSGGAKGSIHLLRLRGAADRACEDADRFRTNAGKDSRGQRKHVMEELRGTLGSEDVGYYGGRGARVVREWLVRTFADDFRRRKGQLKESIADAGGVTGFVERVLVPEIVVRLVKDDMRCDEDQARAIMKDSADLGKLLCEEENDEVVDDELEVQDLQNAPEAIYIH